MTTQMIQKKCLSCDKSYGPDFVVCQDDGTQLATVLTQSLVGDTLGGGKYELQEELGRGGMGVVFRARHKLMERVVAIKMLIDDMGKDPTALQRFHVEAKAASALNHANIIRIYDFDVSQHGFPFIVMDYLQGEPLDGILERDRRMDWKRALPLFLKVCDALGHAHRRQVVHRDMKPSNVMIVQDEDEGERPVVLDFGIAKLFTPGGKDEGRLTRTGEIFGSPLYMSPEQCLGQPIDKRSDIYSVACLIYETLTGCVPFDKSGFVQVILAHVNEPAPRLDAVAPELGLPGELSDVLMKAMSKNAADRFESMSEFKQALATASGGAASGAAVGHIAAGLPAASPADAASGNAHTAHNTSTALGNVPNPFFQPPAAGSLSEPTVVSGHKLAGAADAGVVDARARDAAGTSQSSEFAAEDPGVDPQLREWLSGAEQGNAEDQFDLAWSYRTGDGGVQQDAALAFFWFMEAARNGHQQAPAIVAEMYRDGEGVERSEVEARNWYTRGAEAGDTLAQSCLGWAYEYGQGGDIDVELAAYWYRKAADNGDAAAQSNLGSLYSMGVGVPQDDQLAYEWFVKAAEQGNTFGQRRLGDVYQWGCGVEANYESALYWYQKAAEQGDLDAQYRIAMFSLDGLGCQPDISDGKRKLRAAAQRGSDLAQNQLGCAYEFGWYDTTINETEAFHWYKKAGAQQHAEANYSLGLMYEEGRATAVNAAEALRCFQAAADGGSGNGMVALARCLREGRGVAPNPQEANRWIEKAMEIDCGWAYMVMSQLVQGGKVVKPELDALQLMERAVELDPEFALPHYELGIMYIDRGRRQEGMQCLRRAAELGNTDAEDALASYEG